MKHPFAMSALALIFIGASTWAEGASIDAWFDMIAGKKLVAVDDSTFTLSPLEDGYTVEIISPNGVTRQLSLAYVADGVGTVSDGDAKPIGVFRESPDGLKADFTDGHTEAFQTNSEGGISMTLSTPQSRAWCMRWYPEGHAFGVADRKAALAAYANRLGLSDAVMKNVSGSQCEDSVSFTPPIPTAKPQVDKPLRVAAVPKHVTHIAPTVPVMVRVSEVHTIDPVFDNPPAKAVEHEAAKSAPAPVKDSSPAKHEVAKAAPAQNAAPPAQKDNAPQAQQAAAKDAPKPVQLASIAKPGSVASACLAVDSNGAGWGFRNTCGYTVQFSYCLKNGTGSGAACGTATGSGDVQANGFALILDNSEIVTAEEEFRWVACAGSTDQVSAHLDRPDPPAGRCVPVKAM